MCTSHKRIQITSLTAGELIYSHMHKYIGGAQWDPLGTGLSHSSSYYAARYVRADTRRISRRSISHSLLRAPFVLLFLDSIKILIRFFAPAQFVHVRVEKRTG